MCLLFTLIEFFEWKGFGISHQSMKTEFTDVGGRINRIFGKQAAL